jgi:mannose-1-phosphate guanylyltransferase/mannose-6-phosphate isomerase
VLLVMPADHVITDQAAFQHAIAIGAKAAARGALVTFGIVPDRPETGYGYIRSGESWRRARAPRAARVRRKTRPRHRRSLRGERRLFLEQRHLHDEGLGVVGGDPPLRPRDGRGLHAAVAGCTHDADFIRLDTAAFERSPSDSIDYAVMEKLAEAPELGQGVVVPLAAGWSDVGAWDALWAVSAKDDDGNAARGEVMFEACRNTLVHAGSRLVAAVGCEDMVVVETPDAVMVAHKDRTQDVKKVVARLKAEGRTLTQSHRKVYRPWGWYDSIDAGERFQVKRIVVNPGAKLSLQMHHHRAEHWIVVKGTAEVTNGERSFLLAENESTYIPLGHTHRLSNPGKVPLEIIEVQSGSYLGEDDIVRFEDTYGRSTA